MNNPAPGGGQAGGRRSAARLAAVQALYEIEITDIPADGVLADFLARRWSVTETHGGGGDGGGEAAKNEPLVAPDLAFLAELVRGVAERKADMDTAIQAALAPDGTPLERMEAVLRAILRLGAFELAARSDVDAATIIDEYVELAHAFYAGREPALVNGVLDRLARTLRPAASCR
ncbi:MAG: transcription antitermination factor NusB [Pseudomonadota bacterium]